MQVELEEARRLLSEGEKYAANLNGSIRALSEEIRVERQEKVALQHQLAQIGEELNNQRFLEEQRVTEQAKKYVDQLQQNKLQIQSSAQRDLDQSTHSSQSRMSVMMKQLEDSKQLNEDLQREVDSLRHRVGQLESFNTSSPKKASTPVSAGKGKAILFHRSKDTDHGDVSTNSPHLPKDSVVTTHLKPSNLVKTRGLFSKKKSTPGGYIIENRDVDGDTKTTTLFKGIITPTSSGGASVQFIDEEQLIQRQIDALPNMGDQRSTSRKRRSDAEDSIDSQPTKRAATSRSKRQSDFTNLTDDEADEGDNENDSTGYNASFYPPVSAARSTRSRVAAYSKATGALPPVIPASSGARSTRKK